MWFFQLTVAHAWFEPYAGSQSSTELGSDFALFSLKTICGRIIRGHVSIGPRVTQTGAQIDDAGDMLAQLVNFHTTVTSNALIVPRDDNVARTTPDYKSSY